MSSLKATRWDLPRYLKRLMKLNQAHFESAVENHFQELLRRVARRHKNPAALDWLIAPSPHPPYRPDYLCLGSAGKNTLQRLLNQAISRTVPRIWFYTFWQKISGSLSRYTRDSYLPKLFSLLEAPELHSLIQDAVMDGLDRVMSRYWEGMQDCTFSELSNCLLAVIHEPFKQLAFRDDIFAPVKAEQNKVCLEILLDMAESIENHPHCFDIMSYLCCRANWIDSLEDEAPEFLKGFRTEVDNLLGRWPDIDIGSDGRYFQVREFSRQVHGKPLTILIELDNCGEVVFDLWLTEYLLKKGHRCFLCVKGCAMVNDVTEADLASLIQHTQYGKLSRACEDKRLQVVTSGSFIGGGKLPHEVSRSYMEAYTAADLLIIKGQGNFQSMPMGIRQNGVFHPFYYHKPLVFMTGIKSEMAMMCLDSAFSRGNVPKTGTTLLYYFDPGNPDSWPS